MPRNPKTVEDEDEVTRLVPIKGWVYNLMIARAKAQKRTAKHQISFELERLARRLKDEGTKDNEPGPRLPTALQPVT